MSAAALSIGIGSFAEPDSLPGLAHFLEHMLFMGCARFPAENDFDRFIKAHGGSNNAITGSETTMYHFDIETRHFRGALERFSQCFMSPLLDEESMGRELNNLHAEWAMTVHDEKVRFEELLSTFATPGHPMGRFSAGNITSLKTLPEEKGLKVNLELKKFHTKFYKAQFMKLVVHSKESLEVLKAMVVELFSGMQSDKTPAPSFLHLLPPFDTPRFRKLYQIVPSRNTRQLKLTWALESQRQHFRKKPLMYLASLVGHEGEGSLVVYLKNRNWVTSVEVGNDGGDWEHNAMCSQFSIVMQLTEEGLTNVMHVVGQIFLYLNMLRSKGTQQQFWTELHDIECNEFRWMEPEDPQEYVQRLAIDMHYYPPNAYISGGRLLIEYDSEVINGCLQQLKPDQVNIAVWAKSFENETGVVFEKEPWFHTIYSAKEIDPAWMQRWSDCPSSDDFHLPKPNLYIATNFDLKRPKCEKQNLEAPLESSSVGRLWYRPDNDFCVPKAHINYSLRSSHSELSTTNMCLTEMYVIVLRHLVNAAGYPAEAARLRYYIQVLDRGMSLQLHGFSDKILALFMTIVDGIAAFDMSNQLFDSVHSEMGNFYDSQLFCPEKYNKELKKSLLLPNYVSMLEKKETLPRIRKDELVEFSQKFYKGMFVEALVQGNLTPEEAQQLDKYLTTKLQIMPAKDVTTLARSQITKLPVGCSKYAVLNRNSSDDNTVLANYYQLGQTGLLSQMLTELVLVHLEEPCFAQLRTKAQLGYEIEISHKSIFDVVGFSVTICSQASKFTTEFLDAALETFFQKFNADHISKMTGATFDNLVSTVINTKRNEDSSLSDEVKRNWGEIIGQTYVFKRQEVEIAALKTVKLAQFKKWCDEQLKPNETRRKLSLQVNGHFNHQATTNKPKVLGKQRREANRKLNLPLHEITNIELFKSTCERYTFTRPF